MKRIFFVLSLVPLFIPLSTHAAGFAKDSLFLSKSSVTEGDTVIIHAIVSNDASAKFTGTLALTDGDTLIGTVPVTLAAQEAQVVSVSWKPTAGAQTVTAKLTGTDNSVVANESQTFNIAAKPQPVNTNDQSAATVNSSAQIQQSIANVSPQTANFVAPAFSAIDSLRGKTADALQAGINWATNTVSTKKPGSVLGAQTDTPSNTTPAGAMDTLWFILATVGLYVFSALLWLISNAGIFYPVLAVAFFFILWRTWRRMRRPAWER